MSWANYHTHSGYCDGSDPIENYIFEAVRNQMTALGFTSHAPVSFKNEWSIRTPFDLENYCREVRELKEKYRDKIEIYLGLEADYIPGLTTGFQELKSSLGLDYIIGSIHLVKKAGTPDLWFIDGPVSNFDKGLEKVFDKDIRQAVTAYYHQGMEMIETQSPDIIGHLDKVKMNNRGRYFHEIEPWHIRLIAELLKVVKEKGTIVEINTRGIYKKKFSGLYPDLWVIQHCVNEKIPLVLNSDAHKPDELSGFFSETAVMLNRMGIKSLLVRKNNAWQETGFSEDGYDV